MKHMEEKTVVQKKEVVSCDFCKRDIPCYTCDFCGRDFCWQCGALFDSDTDLSVPDFWGDRPSDHLCKSCWEKGAQVRTEIMAARKQAEDTEDALWKKWREVAKAAGGE
jgi:hypothetical protein